jgi:uncharacterized membrane protein
MVRALWWVRLIGPVVVCTAAFATMASSARGGGWHGVTVGGLIGLFFGLALGMANDFWRRSRG